MPRRIGATVVTSLRVKFASFESQVNHNNQYLIYLVAQVRTAKVMEMKILSAKKGNVHLATVY